MSLASALDKIARGRRLIEEGERELRAEADGESVERPISDVERVRARNMKLRRMGNL